MNKKIISRIKGGLGNQLFCYAAARRLSIINNCELVIDDVSGFKRDTLYKREYSLNHFNIPSRLATPLERLEPFERFRRAIIKSLEKRKALENRAYIEQPQGYSNFDSEIMNLKIKKSTYLDGLWQSEKYFTDIENILRKDLTMKAPTDDKNINIRNKIVLSKTPVALHVRWFDSHVENYKSKNNIKLSYYEKSIKYIESVVDEPEYFIFSDDPLSVIKNFTILNKIKYNLVLNNLDINNAYADLWLMTHCKHFIIANSTFSWWGAWIGAEDSDQIVIAPSQEGGDKNKGWGNSDLIPNRWITL